MENQPTIVTQGVDHRFDHCLDILVKSKSYYQKQKKGALPKAEFDEQWLELKTLYLELERSHREGDTLCAGKLHRAFCVQVLQLMEAIGLKG